MDELMHVVKRMQATSRASGRTKARLDGAGADGSGGDFGVTRKGHGWSCLTGTIPPVKAERLQPNLAMFQNNPGL
ncbi:hypothetical protein PHLCEN_2v6542, partial [Hermanssonia centrifuga]